MSTFLDAHLVLFFTKGVSLSDWVKTGMFDREIAGYRLLIPYFKSIHFVTYGGEADWQWRSRLGEIGLVCNREDLPLNDFVEKVLTEPPFPMGEKVICKSNQVWGGEIPLMAARRWGGPFVARCGYLFSDFVSREQGSKAADIAKAREIEGRIFSLADAVVVTTPAMVADVLNHYGLGEEKVRLIPNFVMTDFFKPDPATERDPRKLLFVGRLEPQKNLESLVEAVADLDVELDIVGSGSQKIRLRAAARKRNPGVRFIGNLPHLQLPEAINRAAAFILPSLYEGHPKTLLEAMACAAPIITTRVPGIQELIEDGMTGILCEPSISGLRQGVRRYFADPRAAVEMGARARDLCIRRFSLEVVVEKERSLYARLLGA